MVKATYMGIQNTRTCVYDRGFAQCSDLEERVLALGAAEIEEAEPPENLKPMIVVGPNWFALLKAGAILDIDASDEMLVAMYSPGC